MNNRETQSSSYPTTIWLAALLKTVISGILVFALFNSSAQAAQAELLGIGDSYEFNEQGSIEIVSGPGPYYSYSSSDPYSRAKMILGEPTYYTRYYGRDIEHAEIDDQDVLKLSYWESGPVITRYSGEYRDNTFYSAEIHRTGEHQTTSYKPSQSWKHAESIQEMVKLTDTGRLRLNTLEQRHYHTYLNGSGGNVRHTIRLGAETIQSSSDLGVSLVDLYVEHGTNNSFVKAHLEYISFLANNYIGEQLEMFDFVEFPTLTYHTPQGKHLPRVARISGETDAGFVKIDLTKGVKIWREGSEFFEFGSLTLNTTVDRGALAFIKFQNTYVDPVIVAYIMTRNGTQSIDVRVKDITTDGAYLFMEEPDNEGHKPEEIGYLVMEKGAHTLEDGTQVEAGAVWANSVHRAGESFGGERVDFSVPFSSTPVVFHTLNTHANGDFMSSVSSSLDATGFVLQQEAAGSGVHMAIENIGWIAIEAGVSGTVGGLRYETGRADDGSNDGVDNAPQSIRYTVGFDETPVIIVDGLTGNGSDGYWSRSSGYHDSAGHDVFAEEDQVLKQGRAHTNEAFGWWAMEVPEHNPPS